MRWAISGDDLQQTWGPTNMGNPLLVVLVLSKPSQYHMEPTRKCWSVFSDNTLLNVALLSDVVDTLDPKRRETRNDSTQCSFAPVRLRKEAFIY